MNRQSTILSVILGFIMLSAFGQVPNKVVVVESTYRPEIEQVDKLGVMPEISDTSTVKPKIDYSVLPSRLETKFKVKPIKPAKLVGSPLDELYKSQVRLGLGNYTTPLAEFNIHNLRSKDYAIGAYVFHRSSHANLKLENGAKVPAGYGMNKVSLYGKRFYNDVNVEGELYLNTNKYRFYGYNTELHPDTTLEAKNIKQFYTQIGGRAEVYSTVADSGAFQYRFGFDANYFGDDFKNRENHLHIPAMASVNIQTFRLDLKADYHLFSGRFNEMESLKNVFQFNPQLRKRKDQWEIMLGLNTFIINQNESTFTIFPEARLSFIVIDDVMQAFFGVDGGVEFHNFSKAVSENPYVKPGTSIQDSKNKLTGYGGIKGQLSSKSGYLADVRFSSMDNVHFFINDTLTVLQNQFIPVYDKMEQVQFRGELWYSPFTFLDFYLKGEYSTFSLAQQARPWHVPASKLSFIARYNFKEKIFATMDIINYGKRYALDVNVPNSEILLDPIWDLNLKLEYKYSQVLSAFADFHNILSKPYYLWNQYPSQKINVLVGFSYKF